MSTPPRQKLEVEDDTARQERLGNLLSNLSSRKIDSQKQSEEIHRLGNLSQGRTWHVPESDALKRAKAFLPLLASSNTTLLSKAASDPKSVDMEAIDKMSNGQVVEMDLGLGVFDVNGDAANSVEGLGPVVNSQGTTGKENERHQEEEDDGTDDSDEEDEMSDDSSEDSESENEEVLNDGSSDQST